MNPLKSFLQKFPVFRKLFLFSSKFSGVLFKTMAPKEEYKAKPNSKAEMNKPKGGKAKAEQRAKKKAAKEAKANA